jgi:hypothetical protein
MMPLRRTKTLAEDFTGLYYVTPGEIQNPTS